MEERIVELELRTMSQQRTIEELSDVVYRQQKELDALKSLVQSIARKLPEPGVIDDKAPERPPHY